MKRWANSKAFVPLISIIFILFASMAMTGCARTNTALITAARQGQTDVVKDLLDKGANANERGNGWTPLLCAVNNGHIEAVRVLIDRGADVNAHAANNFSPLMLAAHRGHANIAKLLVEKGADIEYARERLKKSRRLHGYNLLEVLVSRQQPQSYGASPSPPVFTALPLPTESAEPF